MPTGFIVLDTKGQRFSIALITILIKFNLANSQISNKIFWRKLVMLSGGVANTQNFMWLHKKVTWIKVWWSLKLLNFMF